MVPITAICTIHEDNEAGVVAYRYHGEPTFVRLYDAFEDGAKETALRLLASHMCRKEAAAVRSVLGCFPQELWADMVASAVDTGKCIQHLMFQGLNGTGFSAGVLCGVEELVAQRRINSPKSLYLSENDRSERRLSATLTSCAIMALGGAKGHAGYCVNSILGRDITEDEELEFRKSPECVTAVMDVFVLLASGYWAAAAV